MNTEWPRSDSNRHWTDFKSLCDPSRLHPAAHVQAESVAVYGETTPDHSAVVSGIPQSLPHVPPHDLRFSEAAPKTRGSEQPDSENFSDHVSDVCEKPSEYEVVLPDGSVAAAYPNRESAEVQCSRMPAGSYVRPQGRNAMTIIQTSAEQAIIRRIAEAGNWDALGKEFGYALQACCADVLAAEGSPALTSLRIQGLASELRANPRGEESRLKTVSDIAAMLREIRQVMYLEEDDLRRIAAMVEKQRCLDLIALDRAMYHTAHTSL
jgi:hypothetical protein